MTKALRGINLGGWLVAEQWMTPALFEGVLGGDEVSLVKELGYDAARERLKEHRDTFVTEKDFKWIKSHGFDFVRLPVGYWVFQETDDFIDGEEYVRRTFEWAGLHDLGVVLDFHGLQGSQNGQDHSGRIGPIRLYRRGNRADALATLEYMCKTYGGESQLIGLEVINEPKVRWFLWRLLRYYDRAVGLAERYLRPEVKIIISDAYKPLRMAKAVAKRGYSSRVVLDVHLYRVFSKRDRELSFDEHLGAVRGEWASLLSHLRSYVPVMVGEWSAALPGEVARTFEQGDEYFERQRDEFDRSTWAHSYWSYRTPGGGDWDYRTRFK